MKVKYYAPIKPHIVPYWMRKDGVNYSINGNGKINMVIPNDINWRKLIKDGIVREIQLKELALLV
jgi:hypothetical protein